MHKRKSERLNQFLEVLDQIQKISTEICPTEYDPSKFAIDGSDLSVRILEDLQTQLQSLQKEKVGVFRSCSVLFFFRNVSEQLPLLIFRLVNLERAVEASHGSLEYSEKIVPCSWH